jgi:hypothetical protein
VIVRVTSGRVIVVVIRLVVPAWTEVKVVVIVDAGIVIVEAGWVTVGPITVTPG